jgi:alkylmercury lyase
MVERCRRPIDVSNLAKEAIDQLDSALAGAVPVLTEDEQQLALAVYRLLAAAAPVTAEAVAEVTDMAPAKVAETLRSWPAVFFDDADRVVGFWGLAIAEMSHRLRAAGAEVFAWCAWDPLFLALVIGDLEVETADPVTGQTITYRIDADGAVHDLSHPASVLSFRTPDAPWDDAVMASFCHFVLHFTSDDSARHWTEEHPGTFAIDLADAADLARRHVARMFSGASRRIG